MGLSRERVRQILRYGERKGWVWVGTPPRDFRIKRQSLLNQFSNQNVIESICQNGGKGRTARILGIGDRDFNWLCSYYGIEWRIYYQEYRKKEILKKFMKFRLKEESLPSSYYLQRQRGGKTLYHQIISCFRSYKNLLEFVSVEPKKSPYLMEFLKERVGGVK